MVLEKLGDSLKNTLSKITSAMFVDEKLINELVKEIQRALLQSDTNVQLVFSLSNKIKERAKENPPAGVTKREQIVKILYEELTNFLGKEAHEIKIETKPTKIMLVGLFGSGKTTTAGKLAKYYRKRGLRVAVIQTDTWRPAAYDQLEQLAKQVGVDFFGVREEKKPLSIYKKFESKKSASKRRFSYTISDYAVTLATTPAPTVRPPSRIAKRRPGSIAIGWISSTDISTLSPGITISTPSLSAIAPVTSVVRK